MTPTDIRDTAIPEDVMEEARVALIAALTAARHKTADEAIDIIARAIMAATEAERERCAKIAADHPGVSFVNAEGYRDWRPSNRHDIAAAIRAGTKGASDD